MLTPEEQAKINAGSTATATKYNGYVPPPPTLVGDALTQYNQESAAKLGVTIPGVGGGGNTPPTGPTPEALQTLRTNSSTYQGMDGKSYYSYDSSPVQTTSTYSPTGNTTTNQTTAQDAAAAKSAEMEDTSQKAIKAIQDIQSGVTPLSAGETAQITGLQKQFEQMIEEQKLTNVGATGTAQIRGYQTGSATYDPSFQAKTIGSIITAGANKILDLQIKEASAVAALTQSFKDKDILAVKDAYKIYQDAAKERQDYLQKVVADASKAIKEARDEKQKITDQINEVALTAAKNGASAETKAKIAGATSMNEAIQLAGSSLQTSSNPDIAGYLFYKQQAEATGTTPSTWDAWKKAHDAADIANKQAEAYASARGSALGKASVEGLPDSGVTAEIPGGLGADSKGGSILTHTGLSVAAFNYLTQGTPSMSRMSAGQRNQIMREAQNFLNKNGIDISTFQSQYKAYNTVLEKNISRANQTKIMAGEVSGSADALIDAIVANEGDPNDPLKSVHGGGGMRSLRVVNVLDLLAGKETNSKFAQTYNFQLHTMANDLAGYFAASRGATSPELQDQRDAAEVIAYGMNKGSVEAFRTAINVNEQKVNSVVNRSVDDTREQVWGLFGVADEYAPNAVSANDMLIKDQKITQDRMIAFRASSPENEKMVAELHARFPQMTMDEIANQLGI